MESKSAQQVFKQVLLPYLFGQISLKPVHSQALYDQLKTYSGRKEQFFEDIQDKLIRALSVNWAFLIKISQEIDNLPRQNILKKLKKIDKCWNTHYQQKAKVIPQISFFDIVKEVQGKAQYRRKNANQNQTVITFKDYQNWFKELCKKNKYKCRDFSSFSKFVEQIQKIYQKLDQDPKNYLDDPEIELLQNFKMNLKRSQQDKEISNDFKNLKKQENRSNTTCQHSNKDNSLSQTSDTDLNNILQQVQNQNGQKVQNPIQRKKQNDNLKNNQKPNANVTFKKKFQDNKQFTDKSTKNMKIGPTSKIKASDLTLNVDKEFKKNQGFISEENIIEQYN